MSNNPISICKVCGAQYYIYEAKKKFGDLLLAEKFCRPYCMRINLLYGVKEEKQCTT